jgi:hypothetical protein
MNRPDHIRIGPIMVAIVSDKKTDAHLDDLGRRGDSDLTRGVMRLHSQLSDDAYMETLCHEVLHFVWSLTPLPEMKDPTEEQVILSLSPWLRMLGFLDPVG